VYHVTSEESRILRLAILASSDIIDDGAYNSNPMELTMPSGIYDRNEKHRKNSSEALKIARNSLSQTDVTCPCCGLVGVGGGMYYHIKNCTSAKQNLSIDMKVAPQFAVSVVTHDDYRSGDDAGPCPNPKCGWTGKYGELLNRVAKQDEAGKFTYKLCPNCGFQLCLNCTKVRPKDKRSRFCSHSCQKFYQYRDQRHLDALSLIQQEVASRPEIKEARSVAMKKTIESGYAAFMTPGELVVRDYLEGLGFKHNTYVSGEPLQRCFRLDFYHPDLKINIEIDGESHDLEKTQLFDRRRDDFLDSQGISVIRITDKGITPEIVETSLKGIVP
jgi:very-short-patch-repair endonuclease